MNRLLFHFVSDALRLKTRLAEKGQAGLCEILGKVSKRKIMNKVEKFKKVDRKKINQNKVRICAKELKVCC